MIGRTFSRMAWGLLAFTVEFGVALAEHLEDRRNRRS